MKSILGARWPDGSLWSVFSVYPKNIFNIIAYRPVKVLAEDPAQYLLIICEVYVEVQTHIVLRTEDLDV